MASDFAADIALAFHNMWWNTPDVVGIKRVNMEPTLFSVARSAVRQLVIREHRPRFANWLKRIAKGQGQALARDFLRMWTPSEDRSQFVSLINQVLEAASSELRLAMCGDCTRPFWLDEGWFVADNDNEICDICHESYYTTCFACGKDVRQAIYINNYGDVCGDCTDGVSYDTCEICRDYWLTDDLTYDEDRGASFCPDHTPKEESMCKPKFLEFEFPALCIPEKVVKAEHIITITSGQGDITPQGMKGIRDLIYAKTTDKLGRFDGIYLREIEDAGVIDRTWQTKEGNFPKRFAKHLLVNRQLKLTEELMAEVGNIAKAHTNKGGTHFLSITRDLNLPREKFVNDGSCWWTDYSHSRCELKAWFGFAVRTFAESLDYPISRAWLVPLSIDSVGRFGPTHLLPADAYVLFNSYGMEPLPYARIVAGMTGKSYRRLEFHLADAYINATSGVLIAEQSVCDAHESIFLARKRTCRTRCA